MQEGKLSVGEAAKKYSIPKSTVHDHSSMKVKQVSRPGPSTVLTEERELVGWVITMAEVGYGQCRQQVCSIVKRILDKNARPNSFPNNLPVGGTPSSGDIQKLVYVPHKALNHAGARHAHLLH